MSNTPQFDACEDLDQVIDLARKLEPDLMRMTEQRDRLRFLLWHRHYRHSTPLTAEEMEHIALGAPPESNA